MSPDRLDSAQPGPGADEQQLIAFHLGEPSEDNSIRTRLERDPAFAALSEEIAHTLRVFSADPVAPPSTEAAWQRLRPTLPPLSPPKRTLRLGWLLLAPAAALAACLLAVGFFTHYRRSAATVGTAGTIHLQPSVEPANRSAEADHLDRAERWLTVVNHSTNPLDAETRAEGRQLLTQNAVYLQDARSRGDLPDAAVLDHLDRVLTTANHPSEGGLQLRLDMNTDGLLFQIRILRQDRTASIGDPQ